MLCLSLFDMVCQMSYTITASSVTYVFHIQHRCFSPFSRCNVSMFVCKGLWDFSHYLYLLYIYFICLYLYLIHIYSICHSLSTTFISYVSISLSHQFRVRRFTLRFSQPFSSLSLSHPAVFHLSLSLFHQFRVRQVPIRF